SLERNFFVSGFIVGRVCAQAAINLDWNCFAANDIPCLMDSAQSVYCSDFCGLAGPTNPPCGGLGYCGGSSNFWEFGSKECWCLEGYKRGATCAPLLEASQAQVLKQLQVLWGTGDNEQWQTETISSLMRFVAVDTQSFIVRLDLSNQWLPGTIPSVLSSLTRLTHL
ncbi:unnamed protein product, partial [Closterium sp. Yama58-4]